MSPHCPVGDLSSADKTLEVANDQAQPLELFEDGLIQSGIDTSNHLGKVLNPVHATRRDESEPLVDLKKSQNTLLQDAHICY